MNKKILLGVASLIILLSLSGVFALTWRHAGVDTMRLDDFGNLNVIGNITSTYYFGSGKYLTDIIQGRWNISGNNFYPENLNYDVGIGTTTPQNKLNVIGDINATENITGDYFIGDGSHLINVNDTLVQLDCGNEQVAKWNASSGEWYCSDVSSPGVGVLEFI